MKTAMIANHDGQEWDLVLKPKAGLFDLQLRDVWKYRDLLVLFVKRDFVAQYKQTVLGPLWNLIQPLLTTAMFLFIFTKVARIPTEGIPPVLFYMSGISFWNYFSSCLLGTSGTFTGNAGIFGKVYFPRLITPLSIIVSNMVKLSIQMVLLFGCIAYYCFFKGFTIHITFAWLLIPVLIVMLALLGMGGGIIISSLTTKYRDFNVLIGFAVQLLMYLTPIAYPLSYLDKSKYRQFVKYNPITPIVECFKNILFNIQHIDRNGLLYSACIITAVLFVGLLIFTKVEKTFMDTV